MWHLGHGAVVDLAVLGSRLDWVVSEDFSYPNDSVIITTCAADGQVTSWPHWPP